MAERMRPQLALFLEGDTGVGERKIENQWLHPCQPDFDRRLENGLIYLVRRFAALGTSSVLVTSAVPNLRETVLNRFPEVMSAEEMKQFARERTHCLNRTRREAARRTGAHLIEIEELVCPDGECRTSIGDVVLRPDGVHFSGQGANLAATWLVDRLSPWLAAPARNATEQKRGSAKSAVQR